MVEKRVLAAKLVAPDTVGLVGVRNLATRLRFVARLGGLAFGCVGDDGVSSALTEPLGSGRVQEALRGDLELEAEAWIEPVVAAGKWRRGDIDTGARAEETTRNARALARVIEPAEARIHRPPWREAQRGVTEG